MSEPFIGEIRIFGFNFAPRGWALCNGQLLPITQNTALYAILGTAYGGDGKSTFGLPDLRGSAPMAAGQGPGLSNRTLGESGGQAAVTLTAPEIPGHTHSLLASADPGDLGAPGPARSLARSQPSIYKDAATAGTPQMLAPQALATVGGGQPHNNMMPFLTMNFCIALQGVFPSAG